VGTGSKTVRDREMGKKGRKRNGVEKKIKTVTRKKERKKEKIKEDVLDISCILPTRILPNVF